MAGKTRIKVLFTRPITKQIQCPFARPFQNGWRQRKLFAFANSCLIVGIASAIRSVFYKTLIQYEHTLHVRVVHTANQNMFTCWSNSQLKHVHILVVHTANQTRSHVGQRANQNMFTYIFIQPIKTRSCVIHSPNQNMFTYMLFIAPDKTRSRVVHVANQNMFTWWSNSQSKHVHIHVHTANRTRLRVVHVVNQEDSFKITRNATYGFH